MSEKGDKGWKALFLIAALYDFILGILFFFFYKPIFLYFNIDIPVNPIYLQMAAAFVIAMGVGYYFIFLNLYRNIDLVKLGIVYKVVYTGLVSYFYLINLADIVFFLFAITDAIFLVLFVFFLVYAKKDGRYVEWK